MIAAGKYRARVHKAELGYTQGGREQIGVSFALLDHDGQFITWYGYFTDKTVERTMESLRHCGWKSDDLSDLEGISDNEVEIVVDHDTDERGKRAVVRWVNRLGAGVAIKNVMSDDQKKAFAKKMKGAAVASRPRNSNQRQGSPSGVQVTDGDGDDDDDIPF